MTQQGPIVWRFRRPVAAVFCAAVAALAALSSAVGLVAEFQARAAESNVPTVTPEGAADDIPWALRPYRIRVLVAAAGVFPARPPTAMIEETVAELRASLTRAGGAAWQVECESASAPLAAAVAEGLEELPATSLTAEVNRCDKLILVALRGAEDANQFYTAEAREFDVATGFFGGPARRLALESGKAARAAVDAALAVFSPLAHFDASPDGATVTLNMRADELPWGDSRLGPKPPTNVFVLAAQTAAPSPFVLHWTYAVAEATASPISGRVESAFEAPLAALQDPRIERLALGVRAQWPATEIEFRTLGDDAALSECDVWRVVAGGPPQWIGRSNAAGRVTVAAAQQVERIRVSLGAETLATVPLMAGVERELVFGVKPALSLETQAMQARLDAALSDLLVQRALQLASLRRLMQAKQFDEAERLLAELRKAPRDEKAVAELVKGAGPSQANDSAAARLVDAFAAKALEAITAQAGDVRLDALAKEIAELRNPPPAPAANGGEAGQSF